MAAFVVSPAAYSAKVGFAVACDVASEKQGYPFEVELPRLAGSGVPPGAVVLADRVRSFDVRVRGTRHICRVPDDVTVMVLERLRVLLA